MNTNELAIYGAKRKITDLIQSKKETDKEIKELKKFLRSLKGELKEKVRRKMTPKMKKALSIRMKKVWADKKNGHS
jgi:uncharacterized tellurite resistance protein B-like protein